MVSAFAGLRRWGEEAEKSRTSLREAVERLEGMGMVGVEVGEALGRVGELMGKVGTARWTLRDCLMIMRRGAVLVGERAELGGRKEGGGMVEEG